MKLPEWIRPEWLEPIIDGGEKIGTALSVAGSVRT